MGCHPSSRAVASAIMRSTRGFGRAGRPLLDLAPGGVCIAEGVTVPAGGLLHRRFTLTPSEDEAVCFLLHCPASYLEWGLPTTLPYGVRTFLDAFTPRHPRRLVRQGTEYLPKLGSLIRGYEVSRRSRERGRRSRERGRRSRERGRRSRERGRRSR